MNKIKEYNGIIFENIKHIDEYGNEYWLARELQLVLEYKRLEKFFKSFKQSKRGLYKFRI